MPNPLAADPSPPGPPTVISDYSHRAVWRIAAPLILSNVTVPLLGLVDAAVMGHLSEPLYLGAVAVGAIVFSFIFTGFNFLQMGTTGTTAQAHGARQPDDMRTSLTQPLLLSQLIGIGLIILQEPIGRLAFHLIQPSAEVLSEATRYYAVRIWAAPATLANYTLIGWFIGMQNGRGPLVMLLAANMTNIALDLLFVVGLGMTARGVALASVVGELTALAIGVFLALTLLRDHPGRWRWDHVLDGRRVRRVLSINGNLFVRTLSLMFAFAFLTAQGARQGDVILAVNAILLNLQYFMAYALDGFANAAEALVGKAIGQRSRRAFAQAVRVCLQWSAAVAAIFCAMYLVAGRTVVGILTDIPSVREAAAVYLPWMAVSPIVSVWSFLYDGIYVGATRARDMRNTMLISTFGIFLPAWYVLQPLANHGLWAAFMLFMAARGLTMHWGYVRLQRRGTFVPAAPGRL